MSVSGPEQRVTAERLSDLGTRVAESAFALSRRLGYAVEPSAVYRSASD
jgi:DNA-binding IclR family transcriptional regulator